MSRGRTGGRGGIFGEFLPEPSIVLADVFTLSCSQAGSHEGRSTSVLFPAVSLAPSRVCGSYKEISPSFQNKSVNKYPVVVHY